eukprot:m.56983 g.56983  ORF g.56983 m.56983 type:complete len:345 (-) comp13427_c1_seq2:64-1098(-)
MTRQSCRLVKIKIKKITVKPSIFTPPPTLAAFSNRGCAGRWLCGLDGVGVCSKGFGCGATLQSEFHRQREAAAASFMLFISFRDRCERNQKKKKRKRKNGKRAKKKRKNNTARTTTPTQIQELMGLTAHGRLQAQSSRAYISEFATTSAGADLACVGGGAAAAVAGVAAAAATSACVGAGAPSFDGDASGDGRIASDSSISTTSSVRAVVLHSTFPTSSHSSAASLLLPTSIWKTHSFFDSALPMSTSKRCQSQGTALAKTIAMLSADTFTVHRSGSRAASNMKLRARLLLPEEGCCSEASEKESVQWWRRSGPTGSAVNESAADSRTTPACSTTTDTSSLVWK